MFVYFMDQWLYIHLFNVSNENDPYLKACIHDRLYLSDIVIGESNQSASIVFHF